MKSFICVVLLATAALAAPEGKRDKRGYLSGIHGSSLDSISLQSGYDSLDSRGLETLGSYGSGYKYGSYGHGLDLGSSLSLGEGLNLGQGHLNLEQPVYSAPSRIISTHKLVEVPKVVEVKKIISEPKVVSVPQLVKVSKIVQEPSVSFSSQNSGWW